MNRLIALSLVASALALAVPACARAQASEEDLWKLLKSGGQVVLMRHKVTTPGVGDPPGMRVEDCSTQRNLTEEGRANAKAIGEAIRAHGVSFDRVISSPMCRCLDTAINPRAGLEDVPSQVREMRTLAGEKRRGGNVVLVSHGAIINAVAGIYPEPGEMLVVTPHGDGRFELRGRLVAART